MSRALSQISRARRVYGYRWCDAFRGVNRKDRAWEAWMENMAAEIEEMELLVSEIRHGLDQLDATLRLREKLRQLRQGTAGRTDAEIETAHRLADRLEAHALATLSGAARGWQRPISRTS